MSKPVTVKTSRGKYFYKISEYNGRYTCYTLGTDFWGTWINIGSARAIDTALAVIKSHASKYGSVWSVDFDR